MTAGRSIATLICLRHTLRLMEPLANALEVIGCSARDAVSPLRADDAVAVWARLDVFRNFHC